MPSRRLWFLVLPFLAALFTAGPAQGATGLSVRSVSAPPATVFAGQTFVVRGRIANRDGRARRVSTSFTLRTSRKSTRTHRLASGRTVNLPRRSSRAYSVTARVPTVRVGSRFVLVACVRAGGAKRYACRTAARKVLVVARPKASAPAGPAGPVVLPPCCQTDPAPGPSTGSTAATGAPGPFTPGARSVGDVLFPTIGNGGYDALAYDLALDYDIPTKLLKGVTTMSARATKDLSEFSLDLEPFMVVRSVTVDGAAARFSRAGTKLVVTPPAPGIPGGRTVTVVTTYDGVEQPVIDSDGSSEGWVATSDGATVLNEPIGAQGWFPSNNTPADKALFDFHITVPGDRVALGNGRLVSKATGADGRVTWNWHEDSPMATYLSTASIGSFDFTEDKTNAAQPFYLAIDSAYTAPDKLVARRNQARVPAILDFFATTYGEPYPFSSQGGIIEEGTAVNYSLETQTKPTYPSATIDIATIAHENAHGFFGDSVTLTTWKDIWLNEGMTEFSTWLWQERGDTLPGQRTSSRFTTLYNANAAGTAFWKVPTADPATAADIFDNDAMYSRGAMVCEAMRQILGEAKFLETQRTWLQEHRHGSGTTAQWIATVKRVNPAVSAARLDAFFQQWLYTGGKPTITPSNFATFTLPSPR